MFDFDCCLEIGGILHCFFLTSGYPANGGLIRRSVQEMHEFCIVYMNLN
jgi:hypothetical protein